MDINYLLHREQVERTRAAKAASAEARTAHSRLADLYRARIRDYRNEAATFFADNDDSAAAGPPLVKADR